LVVLRYFRGLQVPRARIDYLQISVFSDPPAGPSAKGACGRSIKITSFRISWIWFFGNTGDTFLSLLLRSFLLGKTLLSCRESIQLSAMPPANIRAHGEASECGALPRYRSIAASLHHFACLTMTTGVAANRSGDLGAGNRRFLRWRPGLRGASRERQSPSRLSNCPTTFSPLNPVWPKPLATGEKTHIPSSLARRNRDRRSRALSNG